MPSVTKEVTNITYDLKSYMQGSNLSYNPNTVTYDIT